MKFYLMLKKGNNTIHLLLLVEGSEDNQEEGSVMGETDSNFIINQMEEQTHSKICQSFSNRQGLTLEEGLADLEDSRKKQIEMLWKKCILTLWNLWNHRGKVKYGLFSHSIRQGDTLQHVQRIKV